MFQDQKLKVLLVLFLVFCVSSSKGIIIYNEETLVALSFIAFVVFSFRYFGTTVQDSLDERSLTIKTEYQNFLSLKQESLQQLAKEHNRISQLQPLLNGLGEWTHGYLSQFSTSGSRDLNNLFRQQVQQKISQLDSSKGTVQQRLQDLISRNIKSTVLLKMQRTARPGSGSGLSFKDLVLKKGSSLSIAKSSEAGSRRRTHDGGKRGVKTDILSQTPTANTKGYTGGMDTTATKISSRRNQNGPQIEDSEQKQVGSSAKGVRTTSPKRRKT